MTSGEFTLFEVVRSLEDSGDDKESGAFETAVVTMARQMRSDPSKIPDLVRFMATGVWSAREAVAEALARVPDISRPVLLKTIDRENAELTSWCLKVLARAGLPEDMAAIEALLDCDDAVLQASALACLAAVGKADAAPTLSRFLSGHSWRIAQAAFEGLMASWSGSHTDPSGPVKLASGLLTSRDQEVHYWGIRILSELPKSEQSLEPLRKYASDSASPMRFFALSSLAATGNTADIDLMVSAVEANDGWFTARCLLPKLSRFADPRITGLVTAAFAKDDEAVAPKALELAVSLIDSTGPVLTAQLGEKDPAMLKWCSLALGRGKYLPALPAMVSLVDSCRRDGSLSQIIPWVVEGIGLMESAEFGAAEALIWAASKDDWYLRTKAVEGMSRLKRTVASVKAIDEALSAASSDKCWAVRNAVHRFEKISDASEITTASSKISAGLSKPTQ